MGQERRCVYLEKQKAAIVTGASSGIGYAISNMLCEKNYIVFGFGRNFKEEKKKENFREIVCDLLNTEKVCQHIRHIAKEYEVYILVNNAGVGYFGPHEEININKIKVMVRTNLELPMIITQLLLRDLKKHAGFIINISSITAKESNTHGCAYGATKAGISSFSKSLFEETRKYGVHVAAIHPDMTSTNFYRNANFKQAEEKDTYLDPKEVADAVDFLLENRNEIAITDITLQPQRHKIQRKPIL